MKEKFYIIKENELCKLLKASLILKALEISGINTCYGISINQEKKLTIDPLEDYIRNDLLKEYKIIEK